MAVTTCLSSWPWDAIHHELFQLSANFGYPETVVIVTFTTWLRFENFTNWVRAIHTSDVTQPSKTLYFITFHYVDVIVYIVQLLVPS